MDGKGQIVTAVASPIYTLLRPRSLTLEVLTLVGFNVLLVLCAYISVPVPFSPVPITGQTFGVLLLALSLGRIRGTGVVCAYLLEGALGLPVFAGGAFGAHHLIGPTGGYLWGFVAAAWVVGALADKGWDKSVVRSLLAVIFGHAVIFASGLAWLAQFIPAEALLAAGLYPFIAGTIIKSLLAAPVLPGIWALLGSQSSDRQ